MILSLPNELQFSIADGLPRGRDLLALACACRQLNSIANNIIYRELHLSNTCPHLEATFDLLMSSNGYLAGKVKRAIFTTSKDEPRYDRKTGFEVYMKQISHAEPWIPLGLLSRSISLESLELHGCPFHTDQAAFVKALQMGCPALRTFIYKPNGKLLFPESADDLSFGQFMVSNLQHLTWYTEEPCFHLEKPAYTVLNASRSTLTSISILGSSGVNQPFLHYDKKQVECLFETTFPALTSLSLGPFGLWVGLPSTPINLREALSLFLDRHPGIVDLVLKIAPKTHEYVAPWNFGQETLPSLLSLNTNMDILSELARANAKSLRTLQKLTITDSFFDHSDLDLDTIWQHITPERFSNVKEIAFNPGPFSSLFYKYTTWGMMERIASTFPNARVWSSNVETDFWYGVGITRYLSKFRHLEEVHMLRGSAICVKSLRRHRDEQEPSWDSDTDDNLPKNKHGNPLYDPRYDIEQQSRSGHVSAYYLHSLAVSCPNISSFTVHSKGWVPDGIYYDY